MTVLSDVLTTIDKNGKSDAVTVDSVNGSIPPWQCVLSADAPAAARIGDILNDSASNLYLITAINGDVLNVQGFSTATSPATGAATIEECYNEPDDWATDLSDTTIYTTGDKKVGVCYDNGSFVTACSVASGTENRRLTVHPDERHDGTPGTGARYVLTSAIRAMNVVGTTGDESIVEWLEFDCNGNGHPFNQAVMQIDGPEPQEIRHCMVHNFEEVTDFACAIKGGGGNFSPAYRLHHNFVFDLLLTNTGNRTLCGIDTGGGTRLRSVHDNTVHAITNDNGSGVATGIGLGSNVGTYSRNLVTDVGGTTTGAKRCFESNAGPDQDFNLSSDGTADDNGGNGHLVDKASIDQFISNAAPFDVRLKDGADAIGANTPTGLLARFSADLINGTEPTWHDIANGIDATLNGSMVAGDWVDDDGKYCLDFDGTDDYAQCAISDPGHTIGTGEMSAGAWFKTTDTTFATILSKTDTNLNRGFSIDLEAGGTVRGIFMDDALKGVTGGGSGLNDDDWHHVLVTRDSLGNVTLYVDGASVGTDTGVTDDLNDSAISLTIGARNNTAADFFTGRIDEVTFWDFALNSDEAKCLYKAGRGEQSITDSVIYLRSGPTHRWAPSRSGNMGDVATLIDSAHRVGVTDEDITLTGIAAGDWVADGGQCLEFNGTDEYGTKVLSGSMEFDAQTTMCLWFKHTSSTNNMYLYSAADNSGLNRIFGFNTRTGGYIGVYRRDNLGTADTVQSTATINDGAWHHAAVVFDQEKMHLYIDGAHDASVTITGASAIGCNRVNVGALLRSSGPIISDYYDGKLDEAMVFDRPLDRSEILAIYNAGRGDSKGTKNMAPTVPSLVKYAYDITGANVFDNGLAQDIGADQYAQDRKNTLIFAVDKNGLSNALTVIGRAWQGNAGHVIVDAVPANTNPGHVLNDRFGDLYLITEVVGTTIELQTFTGTAAPALGNATIEEAYNEPDDWANDLADAAIYASGDTQVSEWYANGDFTAYCDIDTILTGIVKVICRPAAGNGHDGTEDTGARLNVSTNTFSSCITFAADAVPSLIEDLEITGTAEKIARDGAIRLADADVSREAHRCLIYKAGDSTGDSVGLESSGGHVITNCGIYAIQGGQDAWGIKVNSVTGETVLNNTIVGVTAGPNIAYDARGISVNDDADHTVENTIAIDTSAPSGGTTTDFFYTGTNPTGNNNLSSDATADDAGGTGHVINETPADVIVSATEPYDLTLKSGSAAFEAGLDQGTTPDQVEKDITGRDRDAQADTWSIGCFQLAAAGGGVTVSPAAAIAIASATAPTVVLGSMTVSPSVASAIASTQDPTVVAGGITVTPTAAIAIASTLAPTVVLGSMTVSPAEAIAIARTINPTIVIGGGGETIAPAPAIAVAGVRDPVVVLGSSTASGGTAIAIASTQGPVVSLGSMVVAPTAATAVASTLDPTVILGPIISGSMIATAIASTVDPTVIVSDLVIIPEPAIAIASTVDPAMPGVLQLCVMAGQVYAPGGCAGQVFQPGARAGKVC